MGKNKKYIMFIDETGSSVVTNNQPFTLCGVIFELKYAVVANNEPSCPLKDKLDDFKTQCFENSEILLHLEAIHRKKDHFSSLSDDQRQKFYDNLPNFLTSLDFTIISITIDKEKLLHYYKPSKDPYAIAFTHILQNYYSFIYKNNAKSARIVVEGRDDNQNLIVQKTFFDIFNNGTNLLNIDQTLKGKIKGFIMAEKNDPKYKYGLQIADVICNPLSRVRRGKFEANPTSINYGTKNKIFTALKNKIYTATDSKDFRNWGFQKIPITKQTRIWIDDIDDPQPKVPNK
ncbi:MAG: DUF3800 domain-containing protein [Halanaerobiales bacterium]|nr:DUF3800 domain-containing protein [Halanaerobiales bacterium]